MKTFIIALMALLGTMVVIFITTGLPAMIIGMLTYVVLVKVLGMAAMPILSYWGIGWLIVLAHRALK